MKEQYLALLKQSVAEWNQWRKNHTETLDLSSVSLDAANLSGADLYGINLSNANLSNANLTDANLSGANMSDAYLVHAELIGANLSNVDLSNTNAYCANFTNANMSAVSLINSDLSDANLSGANLTNANLSGAYLWHAKFSGDTDLTGVELWRMDIGASQLRHVRWNDVDVTGIQWSAISYLGDNFVSDITTEEKVRANRQIATLLRSQGLNEYSDRFAYQAQRFQRRVYREQKLRSFLPYIGSGLLDLVAGYGFRPGRTFASYLVVVSGFAICYYIITHTLETKLSELSWDEALVLSLTSFHGRGFFPGFLSLGDWIARMGALEAVIGLFIELILIATFSRRFLGN